MSEYEVRINRPYSTIFCSFPIGTATDNFKFNKQKQRQNYFDYG